MAYIAAYQAQTGTDMPVPPHQTNDYLIAFYSQTSGSTTTPVGWTLLNSFNSINSHDGIAYYKKAASSSETIPNAISVGGSSQLGSVLVIRGADGTTLLGTISSGNSAGQDYRMPDLTPAYTNSLIIYFNLDGANNRHSAPGQGVTELIRVQNGQGFQGISYTYGAAAAVAIGDHPYIGQYTAAWNQYFLAFEIKDDGTAKNQGYANKSVPAATLIHMLAASGQSGKLNGTLLTYDPTGAIASINNDLTSFNNTTQYDAIDSGDEILLGIPGSSIENASTTAPALIAGTDLLASTDLSGAVLSLTQRGGPRTPTAKIAKTIGLTDKTNTRIWQIDGTNLTPNSEQQAIVSAIEVDGSFGIDDIGTFNSAAVTAIILAAEVGSGSASAASYGFLYKLAAMSILGGSASVPADMSTAKLIANTSALNTIQNQLGQTDTQYFCSQSIIVEAEVWGGSSQSVSYPGAYNYDSLRVQFKVSAGTFSFYFNPPSAKTHNINGWAFNMGNYHIWGVSSGAVGTVTTAGCVVTGATPILNASATALAGLTLSNSKEITYTTLADLSGGCVISSCVDAQAITVTSQADFAKLANCTFTDNAIAIKITGNQTGTWSDPLLTVSGNTYDIEYTGTTNFSLQSAATLSVNNASSGVLTVVTPTFDLTVNSSQTGSNINVFTTTTQTVLDTEASASQLVYTHSSETVDITVLKDGYLPYRQTGLALSGTVTIDVQLIKSREYDSSHGLVYTTDASWSRALNQLTVPTWGVTGQGVFSLLLESFRTQSTLANTAFNLEMDGAGSLFLTNDAEGASDANIQNLIECGVAYLDTSNVTTASWVAIKSVGTATGFTGEFQQVDGSGTTDARTTGIFNEVVKMFGDASHGNFDYTGHLVLKYQPNTYRESRVDVLSSYGIAALDPTLYIVALQPVAIGITAGDPAITITIVDHTGAPLVVGGKSFDFEIQDGGANDGDAILREVNYNLSLDATYQGRDPFNWPELVLLSGTTYESIYGRVEGLSGLHGVYVSRAAADHPNFTRHQSNDGTYYVKPIIANGSISGITAGSRLRIYNETTTTETVNAINAGTSYSVNYTEGTTYTAGDVISIYLTYQSGVTAKLAYSTSVIAASTGWSAIASQLDDDVYISNGIDGSLITKFTADYVNDEIDVTTATNFTGPEVYAFYVSAITTSNGITNSFGGFTALDEGNYRNNVSIVSMKMDNTTVTEVWQTDTSRLFRSDSARPVRNPTSGGGGIDVNWQNVVYVVTAGSGLSAGQQIELTAAAQASTVNAKIGTPAADVSADIAALKVVADAIPTTPMRGTDSANTIAPDNASITAIKAKTDSLTFSKANELDSNIQSVNDVTVTGTGATGSEWGP